MSAERIGGLIEAFVTEEGVAIAELALKHLFRVHPKLEEAARQCYEGNDTSVSEPLKASLRRYGILTVGNRVESAMIKRALAGLRTAQLDVANAPDIPRSEAFPTPGSSNLREWAEELATLGIRRNLLERRLRAIFLNFVRFDSLGNTSQNLNVRQRIARSISERRRKELEHLSAENMVSRFTWKELTGLIGGREWTLFERIFGDKKQFGETSDVVNDRFDAHAKDADIADIALYRRALTYLEGKVEKIE